MECMPHRTTCMSLPQHIEQEGGVGLDAPDLELLEGAVQLLHGLPAGLQAAFEVGYIGLLVLMPLT